MSELVVRVPTRATLRQGFCGGQGTRAVLARRHGTAWRERSARNHRARPVALRVRKGNTRPRSNGPVRESFGPLARVAESRLMPGFARPPKAMSVRSVAEGGGGG